MAEEKNRSDEPGRPPAPSCSSGSSLSFTWQLSVSQLQPNWMKDSYMEQDEYFGKYRVTRQRSENLLSHFSKDPVCGSEPCRPVDPALPPSDALLPPSRPHTDVVKEGYLGKMKPNHRRYFVLRFESQTGPSRLEWYKSHENFKALEKSSGKAPRFGSSKKGVVYQGCCLGLSRTSSVKKGHAVVLYAKDQTLLLLTKDQREQEEWFLALKKQFEKEQKDGQSGDTFDEEDDGYCTLPPAAIFKEVWPVTVKARGLACTMSLTGESQLCLTAVSLILVRGNGFLDLPLATIPLLTVRCFGHLNFSFFVELGRSAPDGPGEIWMEARDQVSAQKIHEAVRDAVQALRPLTDFGWSPTSSSNQLKAPVLSKRSRPKNRDGGVNVSPPCSLLVHSTRRSDTKMCETKACAVQTTPDRRQPNSPLTARPSPLSTTRGSSSSEPDSSSYMEEKMEQDEEGGSHRYMMMSPHGSPGSSVLPQDDYVTMASPQKCTSPLSSSPSLLLQTPVNKSSYDNLSSVETSVHLTSGNSQPPYWLTPVEQFHQAPSNNDFDLSRPFVTSKPKCTRTTHGTEKLEEAQPVTGQPAEWRVLFSSCLLSCLQVDERV